MVRVESEPITLQNLVDFYGPDAKVMAGDFPTPVSLGWALAVREKHCRPEDAARAERPDVVVAKLAQMLHLAGSLDPRHAYLLQSAEPDQPVG